MRDEEPPADDGQRDSPGRNQSASVKPPPAPGSLTLYVHEESDGVRVLTGGGITADGICADIFATLHPGGVWHGMSYEDLPPGCYEIRGDRLVGANGHVVPSSG